MNRQDLVDGARFLAEADARLGAWIDTVGPVSLRRQRSHFDALCRAILSQQVAKAAAETIYRRFLALFQPDRSPSPKRVRRVSVDKLRGCGISGRKAVYLRELGRAFDTGHLRDVKLRTLRDDEVVEALTVIPGIGPWTAEMFLIFALGRPDVYSPGDLVLRQGASLIAGKDRLTPGEAAKYAERWSPYRSVASLYLWQIVHWKGDPPS